MSSSDNPDNDYWLANHLSLDSDGKISNPLKPVPSFLKRVEGIEKLRRSLARELSSPNCIPGSKSSNLPHLLSIVKCIWPSKKNGDDDPSSVDPEKVQSNYYNEFVDKCPSAVLKPFVYSGGKTGRLIVDIVSSNGDTWYKISARNPKSLALVASGGGGYGKKSIVDHAEDYFQCAEENLCLFKPPQVVLIFTSGVSEQVASELESLGAQIIGRRIGDEDLPAHPRIKVLQKCDTELLAAETEVDEESYSNMKYVNPNLEGIDKLNLDISALLAYTSNLTNGHANVRFKKKPLSDQVEAEQLHPQKCILDEIFEGRQLHCCETAMKDFQMILSTVGGEEEKARAAEFVTKRVTVVPDHLTEKASALSVAGNIKKRSIVIFSTGDALKAVTVTSNFGFVRSARSQGCNFQAFIHEPRALTEQKQLSGEHTY